MCFIKSKKNLELKVNQDKEKKTDVTLKNEIGTTKYIIQANINASGIVERPDVVGAIFGQTEGLLGDDLDLRELQKTGRVGRIRVSINSKGGKSFGSISIPSSLDKIETAVLAASLETIDRVGPCEAKINVNKIEDVRSSKRAYVVDRAKEILKDMMDREVPETQELTEEVKQAVRVKQITKYGSESLPAGPNIDDSDAIIVCEGRADVLNLLKYGIKNAIAVEGTSVPDTIIKLSKEKTVTAFIDGDRGGELILRELMELGEIDNLARAPPGKEVEDLTRKEVFKALRNKVSAEQALNEIFERSESRSSPSSSSSYQPQEQGEQQEQQQLVPRPAGPKSRKPMKNNDVKEIKEAQPDAKDDADLQQFKEIIEKLPGTLDAYVLDKDGNVKMKVSVRDLVDAMKYTDDVDAVVFDGVITQRLVDIAGERNVKYLVGVKTGNITKKPLHLKVLSFKDIIKDWQKSE
ncbi:MAG TPA: DNA primase DnaG [Candidatus Methanofastidiosa archaeon]|nr:DNA primase DnaG [Candidatus Methanofastidiosa archaeon]